MSISKHIIPFFAAATLSSCGIYSTYQRPSSLPLDSLYRNPLAAVDDTSSIAALSWRDFFTDSCLSACIEQGLRQNTDLLTAHLRTEEAKASLSAARLAFLPSLQIDAQGQTSSYGGAKASNTYKLNAGAEWEIDAFGSLRNAKKGSHAAFQAQVAYEQAVQTQLIATIAETYFLLVATDQKVCLTHESIRRWHETVRAMESLKRAGEQTEAAVSQSRASLAETEASLLELLRQAEELENSLASLLGMTPRPMSRGTSLRLALSSPLRLGVPMQLLSRRPDVRQAEWQLAEAFYATGHARSAFYPHITLSGTAGWTNSGGAGITNPGAWLFAAVGSLTQPLFNRGKNRANLKIAQLQQQEAQLAFSQKLLDAGSEVNNAMAQLQAAEQILRHDRTRIEALQAAVNSTAKLMRHGTVNYLEVITAQQTLLAAQIAEVSDTYAETVALISLYHALGGGTE